MSTVLLTSVGGLPQVSVIKHLRTLPEVTYITGFDSGGHYGAAAALCDDLIAAPLYAPIDHQVYPVILVCGDRDAMALNPHLRSVCYKHNLLYTLNGLGVPTPDFLPSTPGLWRKPRIGSGSRYGEKVSDEDLFMEYLPGRDWSVDAICEAGIPRAVVPRLRHRAKGASIHGEVRNEQKVVTMATAVCNALGLSGIINVQLKERADGTPLCYEVNPRISGSIMLSVYSGVDLLRMEIRRQLGLSLEGLNAVPRDGATMHRYYSEAFSG